MAQRYLQGCVEVLQLDERLTIEEVPAVNTLLDSMLGNRLPQIIVDLRKVRLIDSAGLELLHRVHHQCMSRGGAAPMASPTPNVREVLRITGLDTEMPLYRDVVSAAGAFAS